MEEYETYMIDEVRNSELREESRKEDLYQWIQSNKTTLKNEFIELFSEDFSNYCEGQYNECQEK